MFLAVRTSATRNINSLILITAIPFYTTLYQVFKSSLPLNQFVEKATCILLQ